jgi:hypothetical protein
MTLGVLPAVADTNTAASNGFEAVRAKADYIPALNPQSRADSAVSAREPSKLTARGSGDVSLHAVRRHNVDSALLLIATVIL